MDPTPPDLISAIAPPAPAPQRFGPRAAAMLVCGALLIGASLAIIAATPTPPPRSDAWAGLSFMPARTDTIHVVRIQRRDGSRKSVGGFEAPGTVMMSTPSGPARTAGIREQHRILSIGGFPVTDLAALEQLARRARPGETIVYRVSRDSSVRRAAGDSSVRRAAGDSSAARAGRRGARSRWESIPVERDVSVTLGSLRGIARPALGATVWYGLAVIYLLAGLWLLLRRPADRRTGLFFMLSVCGAAGHLLNGRFRNWNYEATQGLVPDPHFWQAFWLFMAPSIALGMLFIGILLHFALVFPAERPVLARRPNVVRWIYASLGALLLPGCSFVLIGVLLLAGARLALPIAAALVLAGPLGVLAASFAGPPPPARKRWLTLPIVTGFIVASALAIVLLRTAVLTGPGAVVPRSEALWLLAAALGGGGAFTLSMALGLAFTIATFVTLGNAYRDSGPEARRQIRWPIWGITTGLAGPLIISTFIGLLLVFGRSGPSRALQDLSELASAPLSLLIPASFVFAILKYRLMEIDIVIRKTLIYTTVTGLLVLAYAILVGGIGGWFVQAAGVKSPWVTAFGTVVVAVLFVPARNRIQSLVDRRFFRARYDIADSLKRMSTAVAEARRAPALMRVAAEEAQQALSSRAVAVFGWQPDSRMLAAVETIGLTDERRRTLRLALDPAVLGALTSSTSLETKALTGPLGGLARHADAALLVPALHRGELRAVLAVGGKLSDEQLTEADRGYLVALAAQLASGLAGIEAGARDRELDEARDIQAALLPRELPVVAGFDLAAHWQPAREVAGDLYDVYPVGDRVALCVADVTGKGMPAALLMSSLQATVRGLAAQGLAPAALGERVNRVISAQITPGRFITMFFAALDPASGVMTYVNAGHNPPMLLRTDGAIETLDAGGLLLGIMPEATYVEAQVTLRPGDRLLLFTDGITEAADATQDLFGEARLEAVLRAGGADDAAGLQRRVLEEVSAFCRGEFQDDATLIVVVAR